MALFTPPIVFSPLPVDKTPAQVEHVSPADVQWNRPVFRPPTLPTPTQIWNEIPFTARFDSKRYQRK
ncbi:MAG: hypothetical protein QM790_00370 [Nibricoccus sp.]